MSRRRVAAAGVILSLVAGCSVASPSPSPDSASPSPSATTSSASPSLAPSFIAPTSSPAMSLPPLPPVPRPTVLPPGVPFDVSWTALPDREAPSERGSLSQPFAWDAPTAVRWGAGAVVVYPGDMYGSDPGPMIWWSPDLVSWRRAVPPGPAGSSVAWARSVVVGGPGLAVLGGNVNDGGDIDPARIWLSADGEHWEEGIVPADALFMWGRPGRLVVFGTSTWVSADGRRWVEAGPSPYASITAPGGLRAIIVDDGDGAIVLVRHGSDPVTPVYRLGSDGSWEQLGSIDAWVGAAARGPSGIVALGEGPGDSPTQISWTSLDGRLWTPGTGTVPTGNVIGTAAGYVVIAGRSYYEGCAGFDPSQQIVNTWTSGDGVAWKQMPEDAALDHVDLPVVLPDGDGLIAIGLKWAVSGPDAVEDRSSPSVWASGPLVPPKDPAPRQTASGCEPG